jgi:Cu-Zn family superoxide dismutase
MSRYGKQGVVLLSCVLLLSACEWKNQPTMVERGEPTQHHMESEAASTAPDANRDSSALVKRIDIVNGKGVKTGTAVLSPTVDGVKIQVDVAGLTPGKHGIHVHQMGVCTGPDFKSAGEHLNPYGKQHGFENPLGPHVGDMLNLEVGADGKGHAELVNKMVTLDKDKANSILKTGGTSLVIHEAEDDYKTDPSGNSGARIACGVIN